MAAVGDLIAAGTSTNPGWVSLDAVVNSLRLRVRFVSYS